MTQFTTQIVQLVESQRHYYYHGETHDITFRKQQLQRLKQTIQNYEKEILQALYDDLHKSAFEAYATEVGLVLDSISHMIDHVDEWAQPVTAKTPIQYQPGKSFIVREPYGVTLIIGPFNYPFQLVMEPLIGAIVGGNTAVVKPSEMAEHTAAIVKKIIEETFESHYVAIVEGAKEEVTALIHAPFDYIFFTGSVAVGKVVAKAAAERLTPIALELGGKSPAIVDQTANLTIAAKRIAWGKYTNAGQTCVAPDYVLVHRDVAEAFIVKLKATLRKFYGKKPQQSPDYGRIINERHFKRLTHYLEQNVTVLTGGDYDAQERYIAPTVLASTWEDDIMQDEIFGPILPILVYDDLGIAIHEINQKPKPLAAYFFSEHEKAQRYFLERLSFGGGCINDTITHVGTPHLPFGGVGSSGVKAYHGKASFESFTHAKSILQKSTKLETNLLFPPYNNRVGLVRKIMK